MQGQRSAVGSLPDSINFDYGSPSSNVNMEQQICWDNLRNPAESRLSNYRISASSSDNTYMGSVNQEGRNMGRWNVGESSSSNPQNLVGHDERLTQSGWSPPQNASVGAGLRLDELRYEPSNLGSQTGVNLNIGSNQIATGPAFVRGSGSASASQNLDLNEGRYLRVGDDMDCPNSSKSIGFEDKFHPSAGTASDPFASSSGSGGFVMENDDSRAGCSLDGRRLSCKRKTLEGNVGQSSSSGSFFPRAEGSRWQAIPPPRYDSGRSINIAPTPESSPNVSLPEQVNPRLDLGMGGGVPSGNIRPLNVPGGLGSYQRNYRLRMNPSSQQDSMSNNSFLPVPANVLGHPEIPSVHQPLRFVPVNPPIDLMSPIPSDSPVPQSQAPPMRAPTFRRNVQSHRWNSLRSGSSPNSALSVERDTALPDDPNSRNLPRNIGEHPMFAPPVEPRNLAQHPTNWSLSSGSIGISSNTGSSSRSGAIAGSQSASGPSWAPHRHPPSQYSRRLSEYVRRSLLSTVGSESGGQSSHNSQHRSVPGSSQDGVAPSNGGSQGHSIPHSRSALLIERQGEGTSGIPYLRALAAAGEGRSRLVSEIRNALDIIRRGEGLRFEDVMIFDQSVLFGMADIHDQHRDMRLDVDNMSYEELLALEERIGNVCTGLSEETILKCMKQRKHVHTMSEDQTEPVPCCVCQEVYRDGEDVGILDCGHDFHTECIKQWLGQKNLCPICKTTGLAKT